MASRVRLDSRAGWRHPRHQKIYSELAGAAKTLLAVYGLYGFGYSSSVFRGSLWLKMKQKSRNKLHEITRSLPVSRKTNDNPRLA